MTQQNDLAKYCRMQKTFYNDRIRTLDDGKRLVGFWDHHQPRSRSFLAYAINDYMERRNPRMQGNTIGEVRSTFLDTPDNLKLLDFGCGVGRLMLEAVHSGLRVDGVDVSEQMIECARQQDALEQCNLFVSSGMDCGAAPKNHYDLAYSMITLQHICVRSIRLQILKSIRNCLNDNGTFYLQMMFYPGLSIDTIPAGHAHWAWDHTEAVKTNKGADVLITPDALPLIYQDLYEVFTEIALKFIDFGHQKKVGDQYYARSHLIISGSKNRSMEQRIYKPLGIPNFVACVDGS